MSTTDKTGEKLLASIRKTKAGGSSAENAGGSAAGATAARPTAVKRKTTPKARVKAAVPPAPRRATPAKAEKAPTDPYQAGRRVWPD